jgi:hypothetical protein
MRSPKKISSHWEEASSIKTALETREGELWGDFKNIEESWQEIGTEKKLSGRHVVYGGTDSPLMQFCDSIDFGEIPAPEIMIWLFLRFKEYFHASGSIELEEVFFGDTTQKLGNQAARLNRDGLFKLFDFYQRKIEKTDKSLASKAEKYMLEMGVDIDPDSFLRSFRRWKRESDK